MSGESGGARVKRVDALEAKEMIDGGVALLDVLPESVYRQEHLPNARNVPLETFEPSQMDSFDRSAPLLIYCFDQH